MRKKKKFRDEREKENAKLNEEMMGEWEKRLQAILAKYDQDLTRKRGPLDQKVTFYTL